MRLSTMAFAVVAVLFVQSAWTGAAQAQQLTARNASGESLRLPLRSEQLRVIVDGQHATTTITQTYDNFTPRTLEGLFSYQGADGTHISGFSYWNGDERIVGEVLEKSVARQLYYNTVEQRRDPGLLEKTGEGAFSFRVYPIFAKERKKIELVVQQWLPRRDRVVELSLPVNLKGAEIDIVLHDERGIRNVRSTTHRVEPRNISAGKVAVRVGAPKGVQRRLDIGYELDDKPFELSAVLHRDAGGDAYVVATLAAPMISNNVRQHVTLMIDSKMSDKDLGLARRAARKIVAGLKHGDRINIIGIGHSALYGGGRYVNDKVRQEIAAYLDSLDEGGIADNMRGFSAALASRTVILLSNGRGLSLQQIGDALSSRPSTATRTRLFAVGIGNTTDGSKMSRIAKLGAGQFVNVGSHHALDSTIDSLAQQVAGPVLRDASLSAIGAELDQVYPRGPAVLYQGRELRFVARLRGHGKARLVLSGTAYRKVKLGTTIEIPDTLRRTWVGGLWGRERVAHLLEDITQHGENHDMVREVTDLALSYNIVTPYTAFLAIPESELSWGDAQTLEQARARKRALMQDNPGVAQLMSPVDRMADGDAMPKMMMDAPASAPMQGAEISRGGACAGCHVGRRSPLGKSWLVLLLATGLVWLGRRRRHPEGGR